MTSEPAIPKTKDVTVKLLATVDLWPEIGLENRGSNPAVEISVDIVGPQQAR